MSRHPAGKLRLWVGQPVNAPFVTPPISLRIFLVFCILSVTGTLLFSVFAQLQTPGSFSNESLMMTALVWFILPILAAHAIAVNRAINRPLIVICTAAMGLELIAFLKYAPVSDDIQLVTKIAIVAAEALVIWWLYRTLKMRVYYALISGRDLPADLDEPADAVMAPGRVERAFTRFAEVVAPHTETAIVVVVILSVILGWASMSIIQL